MPEEEEEGEVVLLGGDTQVGRAIYIENFIILLVILLLVIFLLVIILPFSILVYFFQ